ncbi:trbL/VirB6 plasmid conjugal transfer family protein [Orientia chuto str. Dubai]|uniref:TrbL/VirB6 plasmid conjugal transfer family protein n=1 Tax=Orientia chuto str. Dubai TaxID=1359168 RepID=A0A0F3MN47_9RICK|nr:type IV secretion system protein [Candidatus Orientia mediorientalis]KJV57188.1 trbL/VirB6 plasmid conjugal transfer family protein [Orientia chuto str. Dubai]
MKNKVTKESKTEKKMIYINVLIFLLYIFLSTGISASNGLQAGEKLPASSSLQWMDKYPNDDNTGCVDVSPTWLGRADVRWVRVQAASMNNSWIDSGIMTKAGKSISIEVPSINQNSRKLQNRYLVLHRVDPRFPIVGQTFIIELDEAATPISRIHNFENGRLQSYQNEHSSYFQNTDGSNFINAVNLQQQFFNSQNSKIKVKAGDVIDIALISSVDFFNKLQLKDGSNKSEFTAELYPKWDGYRYYKPYGIYTVSIKSNIGVVDNVLLITAGSSDKKTLSKLLVGVKNIDSVSSFEKCNLNNLSESKSCVLGLGIGMEIKLNQEVLKSKFDKFLIVDTVSNQYSSSFLDKPIEGMYHIVAKGDGYLSFSTPLYSNVKYRSSGLNDVEYSSVLNSCHTLNEFEVKYLNSILNSKQEVIQGIVIDKILVGRYLMYITINRNNIVGDEYDDDIEYIISNETPTSSTRGTILPKNGINIATPASAKLWFRFIKKNDTQLNLKVTVPHDSEGTIKIAEFFYDNIYIPIKQKVEKFSKLFYFGLAKNAALKKLFNILAILYIILYGIYFLLGVVKVTAYDLLIRCSKIIIIGAVFNENSQQFFYDTLFPMFDGGINSLISYAIKTTNSNVHNPFKFFDLVVSRYIDVNLLKIILIEIVHVHTGLTILGILTLWSIIKFIVIMVKVCMELLMSMIAIAILVGLAPMFFIFMLFDRTADLFKRWFSALLLNALMPVIMIIFILIINELMIVAVESAFPVMRICWGTLFNIELNLDLSAIGLPTAFSIPLMAVPFYNIVFNGGSFFNAMDLGNSFAGSLAGVFLLYNLVLLAGTLVGSQVFAKGINRKGMSYVKSIMMQLLS